MFQHLFFTFLIVTFILPKQGKTQDIPKFVNSVYDNLYTVANNSPIGKPILRYDINNDKQIVTFVSGNQKGTSGELIVGYKFVQLMRSFGKDSSNALAFVLGHEMAHILLKQSEHIENIGSGYADRDLKKSLKGIKDTLYTSIFERQADEHAAFFAHMAGYNTTEIGSDVLDAIYKEFDLNENLNGYPLLKERKIIAQTAGNRMKVISQIYDAANLSIAGGKYKIAKRLYDIILNEGFESNDIYNNCGVALVMHAIDSDTTYQKYILPLFLDTKSILGDIKRQRGFGDDSKDLLLEARDYFDKAKNRNYPLASLNLANVSFLLNDYEEAEFLAKSADKQGVLQSRTLLGIIAHARGDEKKAKKIWQDIKEKCPIAQRNLNKFSVNCLASNNKNEPNSMSFLDTIEIDIIDPFMNPTNNARKSDTLRNILKTKILQYYTIEINDISFTRFKIIGSNNEVVHIAQLNKRTPEIEKNELINIADKVSISNRYQFFKIRDKVIKYFPNGDYIIYVIH